MFQASLISILPIPQLFCAFLFVPNPGGNPLFAGLGSVIVLASALYVILSRKYPPKDKHWAYATVGTLLGFWLK